ncbi:hypothetical protein ASPWEDRAFT_125509, partial [Aspergillus wentii DTO 134E9]
MLLPSALPCDLRQQPSRSRLPVSRLFSTPPPSDDELPSGNGLLGTCRALQSLLNGSPAPAPRRTPKPERLQSPVNLRSTPSARSRKVTKPSTPKPTPQPSRGANKRRRCDSEDDDQDEDTTFDLSASSIRFSTPKRQRQAPYNLPLGLSQSDFYSLHSPPITQSPPSPAYRRQHDFQTEEPLRSFNPDAALPSIEESNEPDTNPNSWTADDDERLVELVLEKFKLSRRDWDDCARRMGKDHASVGRRWHSLVGDGNVGLRRGRR